MFDNLLNKILLILLLCTGCASHSEKEFSKIDSELTQKFETKDVNLDRFKTEEAPLEEIQQTVKKIHEVKQPKVVVKKEKTKPQKKEVKKIEEPKEVLPDDYPKGLIKLDTFSEKLWNNDFNANVYPGEELLFKVSFMGIKAGYIKLLTHSPKKVDNKYTYHFEAKLKTADYYSYIYKLEDSVESFVEMNSFLPIKYSLVQRESSQEVDDLQIFDHQKRKTFHWYKRIKKGVTTNRKIQKYIPKYMQDSFSALQFVRGLDLKKGKKYKVPVITRGKIWILSLQIDNFEKISVMDKEIDAIKIKAETRFHGALQKRGDIVFWFSNDKFKKLLKFSAKIKIGTVEGVLVEAKDGSSI